ncbi:Rpc34p [Sugiyamaella lignohabitans]|uniref:DNA-directed RNA polymerase III subunit RPC6 n=1 Tax=Sugiyamaella lignohabitans TaxID=796027 RepID=A0A161HFL4_9ASCO|nr:Rpc34p [Sugiyamaella lignohabitans]ANB14350.1 Rpc34p [Sugiyamaella lignohabitans]
MIKLAQDSQGLCFQAVSVEDAQKVKNMTSDEAMVYSYIETAGREGIWTKTIKMRTNLHQSIVLRCLKSLENQRYIKAIKSVKYPTRKIYMLASLQPSVEVTGGPWFTDSELDSEFIENLLNITWRYVVSLTFPRAFEQDNFADKQGPQQATYPASYKGYPSVTQIHKFVTDSGITNVELGVSDIRALCEVLVYDDRLERRDAGFSYKATWQSVVAFGGGFEGDELDDALDGFTESPCGRCPVVDHCGRDGPVNAEECVYYDEWLIN